MVEEADGKALAKPKFTLISMSPEELQALCYSDKFTLLSDRHKQIMHSFSTFSASSVSSGNSLDVSDGAGSNQELNNSTETDSNNFATSLTSMLQELQQISLEANTRVAQEIESRQGRSLQRWESDAKTGLNLRLVAGCVPLLKDGRVMLISSGKLTEWVLPKGGWEMDECLEEGAIRECFEEAGVLGTLGPKFEDFLLETKKARKFRLDIEDKVLKKAETPRSESEFYSGWSQLSQLSEDDHLLTEDPLSNTNSEKGSNHVGASPITPSPQPDSIQEGVQVTFHMDGTKGCDETLPGGNKSLKDAATASTSSLSSLTHTHVKMTIFPLFVKQVQATWPESHRLRRAFPIDGKIYLTLCFLTFSLLISFQDTYVLTCLLMQRQSK
jgi:ADP-ribose pyrophosphatase YjhB (NUDIX family)